MDTLRSTLGGLLSPQSWKWHCPRSWARMEACQGPHFKVYSVGVGKKTFMFV